MLKKIIPIGLCLLLVWGIATGCKRASHAARHNPADYFQTHFQDESQFIVETIVADLAEQIYFAKFHRLPEAQNFFVAATETPESPFGAPVYNLQLDLDAKHQGLKTKLNGSGPIWSPETYDAVSLWLAQSVGLSPTTEDAAADTSLLARLVDGEATSLEKENQTVSGALENDFTNPGLHEQAAVVLGAFMLREHSGDFFEIRSPLCRMTAHLALARYLQGGELAAGNGQMAEAMLLTLMNNQTAALEQLRGIKTNTVALTAWVRALSARNSSDYRPLDKLDGLTPVECIEWFYALDRAANPDIAWNKLSDVQKKDISFVRIASQENYSVGMGHELLAVALPLEFREISAVYALSHSKKFTKEVLVPALNEMPDRCFSTEDKKTVHVHVLGWGLWAGFLQRQLCHAVQNDFNFLQRKWGVPDEAGKFSAKSDGLLAGLRLYPFVRRFNATDVAAYHQSVDDGFKVTVATPQLVAPECWNYLCYGFSHTEHYQPNPNPHINEWHKHNPPPGTAYNILPRLDHPSLVERGDASALLDQLHDRAPADRDLNYYLLKNKFKNAPTYAQATALFGASDAYSVQAMIWLAWSVKDQPDKYEYLMSKAAEVNPAEYSQLAEYFIGRKEDSKAVKYYEKGDAADPDAVSVASHAPWLVKYYLQQGRTNDARRVADFAGEVYSFSGLEAKAQFLEATKDYAGAFQWYANIEERYEDSGPVVAFCLRYKSKTGDPRFDGEIQKRATKVFPHGIEKAGLADFSGAPADGVWFKAESDLLKAAGLKQGDVIVAAYGVRVHNVAQYNYQRDNSSDPELDLVVWQGDGYHEIKASPPNHRFGVEIGNYAK